MDELIEYLEAKVKELEAENERLRGLLREAIDTLRLANKALLYSSHGGAHSVAKYLGKLDPEFIESLEEVHNA